MYPMVGSNTSCIIGLKKTFGENFSGVKSIRDIILSSEKEMSFNSHSFFVSMKFCSSIFTQEK